RNVRTRVPASERDRCVSVSLRASPHDRFDGENSSPDLCEIRRRGRPRRAGSHASRGARYFDGFVGFVGLGGGGGGGLLLSPGLGGSARSDQYCQNSASDLAGSIGVKAPSAPASGWPHLRMAATQPASEAFAIGPLEPTR